MKVFDYFKKAEDLEDKISFLYKKYSEMHYDLYDFWSKLSDEELNHALIWKIGKENLFNHSLFPKELLTGNVVKINNLIKKVQEKIDYLNENEMDKLESLKVALDLENQCIEIQFQNITEYISDRKDVRIFNAMVGEEKDHIKRIEKKIDELSVDD